MPPNPVCIAASCTSGIPLSDWLLTIQPPITSVLGPIDATRWRLTRPGAPPFIPATAAVTLGGDVLLQSPAACLSHLVEYLGGPPHLYTAAGAALPAFGPIPIPF